VQRQCEEVRDDIDINISQGEYVLPADVVKWHGLKHIMDMQEEAKMGLMAMDAMGFIKEADGVEEAVVEVSEEEPEVNETDDYKDSDYSKKTSMYGMVKKPKVTFIV